ncbi:THUMP domain-containing protein [Trifolium repens]|nr:THUMP domain-containing protein [Trifolium repens]
MEGALYVKGQNSGGGNKKPESSNNQNNGNFPPCPHCKKANHHQGRCWWRPDVKCRKCGNMGHIEKICRSKSEEAKISTEQQEEELFVATCFATSNSSSDLWLIDSGCSNHMTNDHKLFKELDKTIVSKVKIGNGDFISVKGKGIVAIESLDGLKYISDVLYVSDIYQNLLSAPQLVEKGFKVIFEDNWCLIKYVKGRDVFKVKMRAKSYALNLLEEQQVPEGGEEKEDKKPKLDVGNSDNTSYNNETCEKTDNHKIDDLHAQAGDIANDDTGDVDSPKTTKETADKLLAVKQCCKTNVPTSDLGEKKVEEKSIDKLIDDELVELRDKCKKRFAKHESRCNGVVFVQMRKKDGDKSPKDIVTRIVTSATSTRKHMSRFILRILPIEVSSYASKEEILKVRFEILRDKLGLCSN